MNIKELENKTILLFGKSRAFSEEEFSDQLKYHEITMVKEYSDEVILSVDGRMMTPYEQNASDALYENKKVPSITIDVLENSLAKEIDEDTLLMSLKLSHDKERLKSFLQNPTITNDLFLRLIKLYSWGNEDFFENDDNRDVTAAFILRFYKNIQRNHNVEYATTGIIHLVNQTKNTELLKAISELKPLQFHPKIKCAIAMSIYCDSSMQKRFFKSNDENIVEALSLNQNLTQSLVDKFLEDEELGSNVARNILLDDKLFTSLLKFASSLAMNESLSVTMQEILLQKNDENVNFGLSLNDNLEKKTILTLLTLKNEKIESALYENTSTPVEILTEAYKDDKNHLSLAKNESTPIEILYQLQLDSRYERAVKTNAGFGKHIQSENLGWEV